MTHDTGGVQLEHRKSIRVARHGWCATETSKNSPCLTSFVMRNYLGRFSPYSHTSFLSDSHTFILPYSHTPISSYSHTPIYPHTHILSYLFTPILPYMHTPIPRYPHTLILSYSYSYSYTPIRHDPIVHTNTIDYRIMWEIFG